MSTTDEWIHIHTNGQFSGLIPPIKINDQEFVVSRAHALYKYNIFTKQFEKWIQYPKDMQMKIFAFGCAHHSKTLIYIYHSFCLWKINYETRNVDIIRLVTPSPPAGNSGIQTVINDKLHLIGGTTNRKDFTFDNKTNTFYDEHTFQKPNENNNGFYGMALIHISQQKVLMFGGSNNSGILDDIYSYCSVENKWRKLKIKLSLKLCHPVVVITNDKKYAIILGGITADYEYSKKIFVMDLETMKITLTCITCPEKFTGGFGLIMNNKLREMILVYGYIRYSWKMNKYMRTFPDILIELIQSWCSVEELHLIQVYSTPGVYYKMYLDDIMNSIQHSHN